MSTNAMSSYPKNLINACPWKHSILALAMLTRSQYCSHRWLLNYRSSLYKMKLVSMYVPSTRKTSIARPSTASTAILEAVCLKMLSELWSSMTTPTTEWIWSSSTRTRSSSHSSSCQRWLWKSLQTWKSQMLSSDRRNRRRRKRCWQNRTNPMKTSLKNRGKRTWEWTSGKTGIPKGRATQKEFESDYTSIKFHN